MLTNHDIYRELDFRINAGSGGDLGFSMLVSPMIYNPGSLVTEKFASRYHLIHQFFDAALSVFKAALKKELPPQVLKLLTGDLPLSMGLDFHRKLAPEHFTPPVYFRTDETRPGCIVEVQAPGSMWGECAALQELLGDTSDDMLGKSVLVADFCS